MRHGKTLGGTETVSTGYTIQVERSYINCKPISLIKKNWGANDTSRLPLTREVLHWNSLFQSLRERNLLSLPKRITQRSTVFKTIPG